MAEIGTVKIETELHVHVHHHWGEPLTVYVRESHQAVGARLAVAEEQEMSTVNVTVDTVNETATVSFVDDKGDTNAAQPDGSVVAFSASNPAAVDVLQRTDNPLVADLSVNGEGDSDIGATVTDADGNPLAEADGTPWASIESTSVHVDPGAAVGARLSVSP